MTPRAVGLRRRATALPVVVALLLATFSVAVAGDEPSRVSTADRSAGAAAVVKGVLGSAQSMVAVPRLASQPLVKRGGSWTPVPDLAVAAWISAHRLAPPAGWLVARVSAAGHGSDASRRTHQGRAPPGSG